MHFKLETALKAELQNFGIYTENKKARWTDYPPGFKNRGKRTRTLDIWFWRPTFYRLNYTPIKAPRVGLEPTTHRLTADCSTTELSRIIFESGNHLLSQAASHQVSSAVYVLTIVFGMETGVPHRRIITRYSFLIYSLSSPLLGLPAFLPCTICTLSRLSLIIRFLNISYTFKTE